MVGVGYLVWVVRLVRYRAVGLVWLDSVGVGYVVRVVRMVKVRAVRVVRVVRVGVLSLKQMAIKDGEV